MIDYLGVQGTHEQSSSPPFSPPPLSASYGLIESSDPIWPKIVLKFWAGLDPKKNPIDLPLKAIHMD